jgi:ABC-type lipoprotein export system ATPase subunit
MLETASSIGQTIVMVTHDLSIAERADKIYRMSDGQLILYKDKDGYRRNSYEENAMVIREIMA